MHAAQRATVPRGGFVEFRPNLDARWGLASHDDAPGYFIEYRLSLDASVLALRRYPAVAWLNTVVTSMHAGPRIARRSPVDASYGASSIGLGLGRRGHVRTNDSGWLGRNGGA